jgi:hypothetical protein
VPEIYCPFALSSAFLANGNTKGLRCSEMYRINANDEEVSTAAIFRVGEAVCSLKL